MKASLTKSACAHTNFSLASNTFASNVVVRNTFIHVDFDEEDESGKLPFSKMRTEPALRCATRGLESFEAWEDPLATTSGLSKVSTKSEDSSHSCSALAANLADESICSLSAPTCSEVASDCGSTDLCCSSARRFSYDRSDLNIVVRNTFIDVYFDEESEDEPSFDKVKSEPVCKTTSSISLLLEDTDFGDDRQSIQTFSRASTLDSLPDEDRGFVEAERIQGSHAQRVFQGSRHAVTSRSECTVSSKTVETETPQCFIVTEADRQPEFSAGSALHGTGQCKPCAWFWRPQGCLNFSECQHCHMCDRGELKKLKKANVRLYKHTSKQSTTSRGACSYQTELKTVASDAGAAWPSPIFFVMMPGLSVYQCQ